MASVVDICNASLSHLGQRANISSINPPEGSSFAETMAIFYPKTRDRLLEAHNWTWATKRRSLAALTSDIDAYEYKYSLPADYMKAQRLLPDGASDDHTGVAFIIENSFLYTNEPTPVLVYTYRQTDTTKWSPSFVNAVEWQLASDTAGTIVRGADDRLKQRLAVAARDALSAAKGSNANSSGGGSADRNSPRAQYTPGSIRARGTTVRALQDGRIGG